MAAVPAATLLSIAATGVSTLMQMSAQRSAAKKQNALANEMTAYRSEQAAKSRTAIEQFLNQQNPELRAQEKTQVTDELRTGLDQSVGAVKRFEPQQVIAGKVSDEYAGRQASNEAALGDRVRRAIEQLSGIGAPGEVGMREARRFGQTATGVDANNRAAANVSGRYMDAIGNVRPDPFLTFASQLVQGAGIAAGSGAFSPKPASPAYGLQTLPIGGLGLKPSANMLWTG